MIKELKKKYLYLFRSCYFVSKRKQKKKLKTIFHKKIKKRFRYIKKTKLKHTLLKMLRLL